MPIHGEYRMQAAHAKLAQQSGVPAGSIVIAENGDVIELSRGGTRIVDRVEAGMTFVDGLGVGDISDVALRDRRHLSEDGVLIVVATLSNGAVSAAGVDLARLRRVGRPDGRDAERSARASSAACSPTTSARSSCSRSTCTTGSGSSSTTARAAGR